MRAIPVLAVAAALVILAGCMEGSAPKSSDSPKPTSSRSSQNTGKDLGAHYRFQGSAVFDRSGSLLVGVPGPAPLSCGAGLPVAAGSFTWDVKPPANASQNSTIREYKLRGQHNSTGVLAVMREWEVRDQKGNVLARWEGFSLAIGVGTPYAVQDISVKGEFQPQPLRVEVRACAAFPHTYWFRGVADFGLD